MLPSTTTPRGANLRSKYQTQSGFFLLPKSYVYLGAFACFFFGILLGWGHLLTGQSSGLSLKQSGVPGSLRASVDRWQRPTVLVTGGLGFIGSHVVEDLIAQNFNVIIYDDMSNGKNFNKQVNSILLRDITVVDDYSFITEKVDYIIHLAAAISVTESVRLPEKYERINYEGSKNLLEWAKNNRVKRVVAASSAACYGVPKPEDLPLREPSANGGIAPYSQTKFKMEKLMETYSSAHGLPTTALRFFNVYGPRQDPNSQYSGVISWFMGAAQKNEDVKVTGDGLQYRDFVFVKDVARALRLAMLATSKHFDVFNVCTGKKTTVNELAEEVVHAFKTSSKIVHIDPRPGDVKESVCSPDKADELLNFRAEFTLAQGLQQTHDWFVNAA